MRPEKEGVQVRHDILNPIHLRTMVAILESGSFADAARRLGYTNSAVSQQVSALERRLKVTLFERDAHSVRPTEAAVFLAQRSRRALSALDGLQDDMARLQSGALGRLRVGSFATASERLVPRALSVFRAAHPQVDVSLDKGEPAKLLAALDARELDVALCYRYSNSPIPRPAKCTVEVLLVEDLFLVRRANEPWPEDTVSMDALADERWVAPREGTAGSLMLRFLASKCGFVPDVAYRSNNYSVIEGIVEAGLGIALLPALGHDSSASLATARVSDLKPHREVLIVTSNETNQTVAASFSRAIRKVARQLVDVAPGIAMAV